MKNSKQIAETVFRIRDEEIRKMNIRRKRIKMMLSGVSAACVFCAVFFAAKHFAPDNKDLQGSEEVIAETSGTVVPDKNVTTAAENTSAVSTTAAAVTSSDTGAPSKTSGPATSSQVTSSVTASTTAVLNTTTAAKVTEPMTAAQNTTGTTEGTETMIEPKWNEKTISQKFLEFELDGKRYVSNSSAIDSSYVGGKLCNVTMTGYDIYEEKEYHIGAEVFAVRGISEQCAAAVRFEGFDGYYVYKSFDYHPVTLGQLAADLGFDKNVSFGTVYLSDDITSVTDYDESLIRELISEYSDSEDINDPQSASYVPDSYFRRKLFSAAINVEILGIGSKAFTITEDGYIVTNIMEWGNVFYIGEERAQELYERLGLNNVEPATRPDIYHEPTPEEAELVAE